MYGAKEALDNLYRAGHEIVIHSCGRPHVIADWCAYWRIPYMTIWQGQGKPTADCYLDDLAVAFTQWADLDPDPRFWLVSLV